MHALKVQRYRVYLDRNIRWQPPLEPVGEFPIMVHFGSVGCQVVGYDEFLREELKAEYGLKYRRMCDELVKGMTQWEPEDQKITGGFLTSFPDVQNVAEFTVMKQLTWAVGMELDKIFRSEISRDPLAQNLAHTPDDIRAKLDGSSSLMPPGKN